MTRKRLPPERPGSTLRVKIPRSKADYERDAAGRPLTAEEEKALIYLKMYVTVSTYEDGSPGEIFIRADKVGSFEGGILDALAICLSIGLQHGIELEEFTSKLRWTKFEPRGFTGHKDIPVCTSPIDLIARWLDLKFGKPANKEKIKAEEKEEAKKEEPNAEG